MNNALFMGSSFLQRQGRCKVGASPYPAWTYRLRRETGVTMMEVLAVVAIVGIMGAMAAPNISSFIANTRVSSATNDLVADLMLARATAVSTGKHVVVCPSQSTSPTGATCTTNLADWKNARIVFIDNNNNGTFDTSDSGFPNTPLKFSYVGLSSSLTVTMPNPFPSGAPTNSANVISYSSYGGLSQLGSGQFKLCITGSSLGRSFTVDYSGRPISPTRVSCP